MRAFPDGTYALESALLREPVLRAEFQVELRGGLLRSSAYPQREVTSAAFRDSLGSGKVLEIRCHGLTGQPDMVTRLRLYDELAWGDVQTDLVNVTDGPIFLRAIRPMRSVPGAAIRLGATQGQDRVLSDSFSEDAPQLQIRDMLQPADRIHRGYGSQVIYNRESRQSFFVGALSAERFLTVIHLKAADQGSAAAAESYDVESTGTNEALGGNSAGYPAGNDVRLEVRVGGGETVSSARVMFAIGPDYHAQLEEYGRTIRVLHDARVALPTPVGWWSWTAFYYGVTQSTMLTNAEWLQQNLASLGYRYFQIDEGYQYARGEYATSDAASFPLGVGFVGQQVTRLGLTFGVWVAPFQVSERSWVYQHHPEWLVHTRDGHPVHLGKVAGRFEELYALDCTHPGAQAYLRSTYQTLTRDWNVRFIKMDFMDSAAVEGVFYRPNTTALEAQRTGLGIIREAVGDRVVLDKDGGPMLTPVGVVDAGRTSQDTGHTFAATRDAASGVIARFYMNRNFYIADPDAFTVSRQVIPDRDWHGNRAPLTLEEAEASIALSAVSGGMFEIGDDLPTLGSSPERLALVRNGDLLDMARLGRASYPVDLLTYLPEDGQPSLLSLKESARQTIVTIFNWTEKERSHTLALAELVPGDLVSGEHRSLRVTDVFRGGEIAVHEGRLAVTLPAHSVRMMKVVDTSAASLAPSFRVEGPGRATAGQPLHFAATADDGGAPALRYVWEFGDGTSEEGRQVEHAYTFAGHFQVSVTAFGLGGVSASRTADVEVTGFVPTVYNPALKQRPAP